MKHPLSRRDALKIGAGGFWLGLSAPGFSKSPNQKLNFAHIGVGGRGGTCFSVSNGHNVVALCDVDERPMAKRAERLEGKARRFSDYRKLFDAMMDEIDAVVIATPDHSHALPCLTAIRNGKHVYCEKPLAHTVHECLLIGEETRKAGVMTQMGNQANTDYQFHRAAELIRTGYIGKVTEVHVNSLYPSDHLFPGAKPEFGDPKPPKGGTPIPDHLDWDNWLGGATDRSYHPTYCPKGWRAWRDFGTGTLGDFFCHHADPAFMALGLGQPTVVEAAGTGRAVTRDRNPGTTVRYTFPARGDQPPVTLYWHMGKSGPPAELVDVDLRSNAYKRIRCLMVGDKGALAVGRGMGSKAEPILLPHAKFQGTKLPESSLGKIRHHTGQLAHFALHGGGLPGSNFGNYAANLSACALLGHVAFWAGGRIEWDATRQQVTNVPEANRFIRKTYRKGWDVS